jgi:hypothetical protein
MAIKLELEVAEVNGILQALGQMPFAQVEPLVAKIREQAVPQANEQVAEKPVE